MESIEQLHEKLDMQIHILRENESRLKYCYQDDSLDPTISFDNISKACREIKTINHQIRSQLGQNKELDTPYNKNTNKFYKCGFHKRRGNG